MRHVSVASALKRSIEIEIEFDLQVDGGWSSWSDWFSCQQVTGEKCLCRTRTCSRPTPQFDGQSCQGATIEINQCEGNSIHLNR
jgi:hypothetical protein